MAKLERPQCEFRGAVPHPASPAYRLVWDLQSGTVAKWSCGCHRFSFGGRPYWVNRCEGLEDGKPPRTHEYAALLEYPLPEKYRLGGDEALHRAYIVVKWREKDEPDDGEGLD